MKDITDVYDLDSNIDDIPTTITTYKEYIWIGWLNGIVYISHYATPYRVFQLSFPPHFGFGAIEEVENKEYPDVIISIMDENNVVWIYSDKTLVFFEKEDQYQYNISYFIQNHAKGIHSIQMLPEEGRGKGFCFVSGSSDKTIRKWNIDIDNGRFESTQTNIGMLWDEYSHLKQNPSPQIDDNSDDLGQIRVIKLLKINNETLIIWGDAWGYIWIFNSEDLILRNIKEIHDNEIFDIAICNLSNKDDSRHNLIVTWSRDNKTKSFKYIDQELTEVTEFIEGNLPVIALGFIDEANDQVKLVYIDARNNLLLRSVKETLMFSTAIKKDLNPRKFYSLAVCENKIAIGMDNKIQFGELKSNNYWALMKSALGGQSQIKDFVKIEIDDSCTFIFSSSLKSKDVHCIDFITTRIMSTFSTGESITWMKISPDNKYFVTCSSRGCFYIWKLKKHIYSPMNFKAKQKEMVNQHPSIDKIVGESNYSTHYL